MTTTIGEEIKKRRLEKGLTQVELAENICTQATISNLENKGTVPTILILLQLTDKLDMELDNVLEYTKDKDNGHNKVFKEVRELCSKALHGEAHELLKSGIDFDKLETIYDIKLFYYYMGITSLMGVETPSDAIYYFNQVLSSEADKSHDFLDVSATNGIGIAYYNQNENEKALTYFERSLEQLDELFTLIDTINNSPEIAKMYYNSAKFYSEIGEYNKAVNLSNLGIELLKKEGLTYYLDVLLYEKAFNLMELGKKTDSEKNYLHAMVTADSKGNNSLMDTIKSDVEKYGIQAYNYY
ncbi:helix-turn-helix transcriptional regulator [Carnobacterium maltaromaticum]|uniref:helix-turn-helix transcriptional regulator n=1 Tax=Carnobacterium maltaromaticum TaxID=2751 RepID=UPI0012FCF4F3|nr:helix-turn-helix transcriptional regulator [Carnobacterium maltaromaticum]